MIPVLTGMKNHFRFVEPFFPARIMSYDMLCLLYFLSGSSPYRGDSAERLCFVNNVCSGYV